MSHRFVAAIDQGTTSTRCIVFDAAGRLASIAQREHPQSFPRPGWVEHDPVQIWRDTQVVVADAVRQLGPDAEVVAIGVANQRETVVVWDRRTGRPIVPAIAWQDTRTADMALELRRPELADRFFRLSGLQPEAYYTGPRLRWLLDHHPGLRRRAESGDVLAGTMDSWLLWNLTGGPNGGRHVTDVTNASRTMMMDIATGQWHPDLLDALGVPAAMLGEIVPSVCRVGVSTTVLPGTVIGAAFGDQQAALFGHACFAPGDTKCTLGSGGFLLMNTGTSRIISQHGLLSTVGYQIEGAPLTYALEGSIAVTGSLVQWLRDGLGLITFPAEVETLARSVSDNGGCYVVPAFAGLFAPHWRSEARGVVVGLTSYITKGHIARAVLEATAWQTREVVQAMQAESGSTLAALRIDGGMTSDNLLMQIMADVLAVPVERSMVFERVSLGAAFGAGLTVGLWPDPQALPLAARPAGRWHPSLDATRLAEQEQHWKRAVQCSLLFGSAQEASAPA